MLPTYHLTIQARLKLGNSAVVLYISPGGLVRDRRALLAERMDLRYMGLKASVLETASDPYHFPGDKPLSLGV
jgi:hypothetical protein